MAIRLKTNEVIPTRPNRSGESGFSASEFRNYIFELAGSGGSLGFTGVSDTQVYNDASYTKINIFNTIRYQQGAVQPSIDNKNITVEESALYRLSAGFSIGFSVTEQIAITAFVNDAQVVDNPPPINGRSGAPPPAQIFSWDFELKLNQNDIIDLQAINNLAGNVTVTYHACYFTIERIGNLG